MSGSMTSKERSLSVAGPSPLAARWLRLGRVEPRLRLFCLPPAGAGALQYLRWQPALPADVEVCPVMLPGREARWSEPPARSLTEVAGAVAGALTDLPARPFALFGFSMGSWVAFEVTRELRRRGAPLPRHLLLASRRAPGVRPPARLSLLPERDLIALIQTNYGALPAAVLQSPELLQSVLRTVRADFEMLETYELAEEQSLPVPITTFRGQLDSTVSTADLSAWARHSSQPCTHHELPGGHFFDRHSGDRFVELIGQALRPYLS